MALATPARLHIHKATGLAAALAEFEATLTKEPGRFRSLYGAARAARLAGDAGTSRKYFGQLLKVCGNADEPGRAEIREARAAISAN